MKQNSLIIFYSWNYLMVYKYNYQFLIVQLKAI